IRADRRASKRGGAPGGAWSRGTIRGARGAKTRRSGGRSVRSSTCMIPARFVFAAVATLLASGLTAAACSHSNGSTGSSPGSGGGGGNGPIPDQICLLHNCDMDFECAACSDGRTHCLASEHRCVACGSGGTTGCPSGQKCSSYGNCVPSSASCPTNNGVPTI